MIWMECEGKTGAQGKRERRPTILAKRGRSDAEARAEGAGKAFVIFPARLQRDVQNRGARLQKQRRSAIEPHPSLVGAGRLAEFLDGEPVKLPTREARGAGH